MYIHQINLPKNCQPYSFATSIKTLCGIMFYQYNNSHHGIVHIVDTTKLISNTTRQQYYHLFKLILKVNLLRPINVII